METVHVNLKNRSYDIHVGANLLEVFDFESFRASTYIIITDGNVKDLYGTALQESLKRIAQTELIAVPPGEASKSLKTVEEISSKLAKLNIDKDAIVIALGGGIVGDLAGFVASIYKRGIRHIQIPTTLLSQVDSSIGGKTGVNTPEGKNLLGTIHQPLAVIIDTTVLNNLPKREIQNGLAEIIKYGVILDEELFHYLESNINNQNEIFYTDVIKRSVIAKASIVEKDENEKELRKILNYGHTIGHGIEILSQYNLSHGEAIAIGMVYEGKAAVLSGAWTQDELEKQNALITTVGLPLSYKMDIDRLIEIMKRDKKTKQGSIQFVFPEKIGKVKAHNNQVTFSVDEALIKKSIIEG